MAKKKTAYKLEQQYNIEEDITTDDSSVDEKNHDDTTSSD